LEKTENETRSPVSPAERTLASEGSELSKPRGGALGLLNQRQADKQRQALIRRLERQEAESLAALEHLEAEKSRLETELAKPEVYSNGEKARSAKAELDRTSAALEAETARWEKAARELQEADGGNV
jgi:ATP-binding cassette subfamily F protein 3